MFRNMIPGSNRIPGIRHTAASATKNLLDASARLQLAQISTLPSRHPSLIWPFEKMETVKRTVLSQLSLLDPCMHALASVLVSDVNWIASHTFASVCSSSTATILWCSATWFLVTIGSLEAVTQQHQQPRFLPAKGLRRLPNSTFLSFQHCQGDTLHWSDPLRK